MSDPSISLSNDFLSASIQPLGAELISLRDAEGRELMTDADPRWWTGHAPLLFPIVGRLANDRYKIDGEEFEMPQHGFARRRVFELVEMHACRALFQLAADAETLKMYPFQFQLDTLFELDGPVLKMTARVSNVGTKSMPFSIGFHPAFAWPLPYAGGIEAHRILFDDPEPAPVRRVTSGTGLVAAEPQVSPVEDRLLRPHPKMFEGDAIIWDNMRSRGLWWGVEGQPNLRIEFPDTPWLGVWQKPGAHFLCIEPWSGMADPVDFTGDIWDKPGIVRLEPGTRRQYRLSISLVDTNEL